MAFKKLEGCDGSDMALWAVSAPAANFEREVVFMRDMASRALLDCKAEDHDQHAQKVKAFNKVLGLLEEARKLK